MPGTENMGYPSQALLCGEDWVVVQPLSRVQLCDPMDCSMPGFPVLHCLWEFAQTHVHWVGDAIQPSHLFLINGVILFVISPSRKDEEILLPNVGKDVKKWA